MRQQSIISLDPIDVNNKRNNGLISRLLKTRWKGGKSIRPTDPFGHYTFCGKQRSGKTVSALWYCEFLTNRYLKKGFKVKYYSNFGIGETVTKYTISPLIRSIIYQSDVVHIIIIDEIQGYFPKDTRDKDTLAEIDKLTTDFSQLAKKQIYVLTTAQVYGRINKSVREQALFMVYNRKSKISNKIVSEFIDGDDILCDELGRWSGNPVKIYVHGLPKQNFDTHKMITE